MNKVVLIHEWHVIVVTVTYLPDKSIELRLVFGYITGLIINITTYPTGSTHVAFYPLKAPV